MVIVNRLLRSFLSRIREKFLNLDFNGLSYVCQASTALSRRRCGDICRDQDSLVNRLESDIFANLGALFNRDQTLAKLLRCHNGQLMLTHMPWATEEIVNTDRKRALLASTHRGQAYPARLAVGWTPRESTEAGQIVPFTLSKRDATDSRAAMMIRASASAPTDSVSRCGPNRARST